MALRSNGPVMFSFPAFRGMTRRIILLAAAVYFAVIFLSVFSLRALPFLLETFALQPDRVASGLIFQVATYPFFSFGLLTVLFSLMSVWYFGSTLEDERGPQWLLEYFVTVTVGGGLLAVALAYASNGRIPGISPDKGTFGMWPAAIAMVLAFARLHAEEQIRFNFIFQMKAKYLAAIYILVYLALTLAGHDRFGALVVLTNALCGYFFLRFAPRRGLGSGLSERWYGMRNAFYRRKRQTAAKKFKVYMGKQGKDVSIDSEGRYVDPNGKPRDPNDKRWMN